MLCGSTGLLGVMNMCVFQCVVCVYVLYFLWWLSCCLALVSRRYQCLVSVLLWFSTVQSSSPPAPPPPPPSPWLLKRHSPVCPCVHAGLTDRQHGHGGVKVKLQLAGLTTCRTEEETVWEKVGILGRKMTVKYNIRSDTHKQIIKKKNPAANHLEETKPSHLLSPSII